MPKKGKEKLEPTSIPDDLFVIQPIYNKGHKEEDGPPHELMFRKNCRVGVVGTTGSGKSQCVANIIANGIGPSFDKLYLAIANPDQPVYTGLVERLEDKDEDGELEIHVCPKIEDLPSLETFNKKIHTLIIFDDQQEQGAKIQKKIGEFFSGGRTRHVSSFYLAQNYIGQNQSSGLPTTVRKNIDYLILFPRINDEELEKIHKKTPTNVGRDDFIRLYHYATKEPHNFLLIDMLAPEEKRFRKNLNQYISV